MPSYARPGDAGADLRASGDVVLAARGGRALVPTGVAVAIPEGHAGLVLPRSGLALRHGVTCLNTPGLIDAGYRGELLVLLVNHDPVDDYAVQPGGPDRPTRHRARRGSAVRPGARRGLGGGHGAAQVDSATRGPDHATLGRTGRGIPVTRDPHHPPARGSGPGARPARRRSLALLPFHAVCPDPSRDRAATPSGRPAAPAGVAGAVRAPPSGVGRRPGFRIGRPPLPRQPPHPGGPGRARCVRGHRHEPPARP